MLFGSISRKNSIIRQFLANIGGGVVYFFPTLEHIGRGISLPELFLSAPPTPQRRGIQINIEAPWPRISVIIYPDLNIAF